MNALLPANEEVRLMQVRALKIIDTLPEESFNSLVEGVANLLDVPVALISLIDETRQWYKAKFNFDACETSRDQTFCTYALLQSEPLVVPDALLDERFCDHPSVTGEFRLRFYAGVPIVINDQRVGTVCCIDFEPRTLSPRQIKGLQEMAHQAAVLMESRILSLKLVDSERLFGSAIHSMHEGIILQNSEGEVLVANEQAGTILGLPFEQVKERGSIDSLWHCLHEDGTPWDGREHPAMRAIETGLKEGGSVMGVLKPTGGVAWILVNAIPLIREGEVRPHGVVSTFCDITERKRHEAQIACQLAEIERSSSELERMNAEVMKVNIELRELSSKDSLTRICNQRTFRERLIDEVSNCARRAIPCSLIVMDIDHFKAVNDTFGHLAGDAVLRDFATILSSSARKGELVARYGGEEFVMLLPGVDAKEALRAAERLRRNVEKFKWSYRSITASFGVSTLTLGMNPNDLIAAADEALYVSKRGGRNCVSHSSDGVAAVA
jgi:diguanylate cyclase (GGDEF)-like protein/PAS domain S-box-containing protein